MFKIVTNISMKCKYSTYLKNCLFIGVGYHRLCCCSVLIVISLLFNDALRRCNLLIVISLLINYVLCRCNMLIVVSLLVNYRLCG